MVVLTSLYLKLRPRRNDAGTGRRGDAGTGFESPKVITQVAVGETHGSAHITR